MLATIISCVISGIFSCVVVAIPISLQHKHDREKYNDLNIKSNLCSLRNDILTIYEGQKDRKEISLYQKQAVHYSHECYREQGGNSFVDEIVKEMDTWKVLN